MSPILYYIGNLITYYHEYLFVCYLSQHSEHTQIKYLFQQMNEQCKINDSESCLWAGTRCSTMTRILSVLLKLKSLRSDKMSQTTSVNKLPKLITVKKINYIEYTQAPLYQ
jgi:hypothetical protein